MDLAALRKTDNLYKDLAGPKEDRQAVWGPGSPKTDKLYGDLAALRKTEQLYSEPGSPKEDGQAVWGPGSPKEDEQAVWEPGSLTEDGSYCERSWCICLTIVTEEKYHRHHHSNKNMSEL